MAEQEMRFRQNIAYRIEDAITPLNPRVRAFALRMAAIFPGEYNLGQVCSVWYYLKERWSYVSDPRGADYFAPASESIESNLSGDCDDFAILMASSIEAIGGSARIIVAYGKQGAHAYCEVFASRNPNTIRELVDNLVSIDTYRQDSEDSLVKPQDSSYKIYFHRDKSGYWLNLDYSSRYPGGPLFPSYFEMAVYPDGRWEVIKGN